MSTRQQLNNNVGSVPCASATNQPCRPHCLHSRWASTQTAMPGTQPARGPPPADTPAHAQQFVRVTRIASVLARNTDLHGPAHLQPHLSVGSISIRPRPKQMQPCAKGSRCAFLAPASNFPRNAQIEATPAATSTPTSDSSRSSKGSGKKVKYKSQHLSPPGQRCVNTSGGRRSAPSQKHCQCSNSSPRRRPILQRHRLRLVGQPHAPRHNLNHLHPGDGTPVPFMVQRRARSFAATTCRPSAACKHNSEQSSSVCLAPNIHLRLTVLLLSSTALRSLCSTAIQRPQAMFSQNSQLKHAHVRRPDRKPALEAGEMPSRANMHEQFFSLGLSSITHSTTTRNAVQTGCRSSVYTIQTQSKK